MHSPDLPPLLPLLLHLSYYYPSPPPPPPLPIFPFSRVFIFITTRIPNHIPPPFRVSFPLSSMTTTKRAYKLRILPFSSLHFYLLLLLSYVSNLKFIIHLHPSSFLRRCDLKFAVDVILIYFPCTPSSDLINDYIILMSNLQMGCLILDLFKKKIGKN